MFKIGLAFRGFAYTFSIWIVAPLSAFFLSLHTLLKHSGIYVHRRKIEADSVCLSDKGEH